MSNINPELATRTTTDPGPNDEATLLDAVGPYLDAIKQLALKEEGPDSIAQQNARAEALSSLREVLAGAERRYRSAQAASAGRLTEAMADLARAQRCLAERDQALVDRFYADRFAQQAARFLGLEIDAAAGPHPREYSLSGSGFDAELSTVFDPELRRPVTALLVGNPAEGIAVTRIVLGPDGLTEEAVQRLSGIFGVRPTRDNLPAHLLEKFFVPASMNSDLPSSLAEMFAGLPGVTMFLRTPAGGPTSPPCSSC